MDDRPNVAKLDEVMLPSDATRSVAHDDETLHTVIANQARTRSAGELWTTAVGGGVNALLVWLQVPSLHWLAAGFAGVAAYGTWGLIDRKIRNLKLENANQHFYDRLLRLSRGLAGAGGWAMALTAIMSFLTAALRGLSLPGG